MTTNAQVSETFDSYPHEVARKCHEIRASIHELADEPVAESLKWGEPSFVTKRGSAVRVAWKEDRPDHVGIFFHCQTSLVESFRVLFPELEYEGNRCIWIVAAGDTPAALADCIRLACEYHDVKDQPLLGYQSDHSHG